MRPSDAPVSEVTPTDDASMLEAMGRGVAQALKQHQQQGVPIITWDRATQRTVEIPAEEIADWIARTSGQSAQPNTD